MPDLVHAPNGVSYDPITYYFPHADLLRHGYIDTLQPIKVDSEFELDGGNEAKLHPIFARSNWFDIQEKHWRLLQPSLQIASRFLEDPSMHEFVHAIIYGPWDVIPKQDLPNAEFPRDSIYAPRRFGHVSREELEASGRWHDMEETWQEVRKMHDKILFTWNKEKDDNIFACALPNDLPGLRGP